MSNESNKIGALANLRAADASGAATPVKQANDKIGKNEFLNMLVTQLKNQDPLDPMKNDQFAVNLAQFSQLEQLISIRQAVEGGGNQQDVASLSGYLGTEVTLDSTTVQVKNHDGGRIRMNLASDATSVKVELLNIDGSVRETHDLGAVSAGKHSVKLDQLTTGSGEYQLRVTATGASGQSTPVPASVSGIVTGFIPGADPSLLIGDKKVSPDDVQEVNLVTG